VVLTVAETGKCYYLHFLQVSGYEYANFSSSCLNRYVVQVQVTNFLMLNALYFIVTQWTPSKSKQSVLKVSCGPHPERPHLAIIPLLGCNYSMARGGTQSATALSPLWTTLSSPPSCATYCTRTRGSFRGTFVDHSISASEELNSDTS
jgi:hypothetical protein